MDDRRWTNERGCTCSPFHSSASIFLLFFRLPCLAPLLVHRAGRSLLGLILGDASLLVRIAYMFVLAIALATFFDSSWHFGTPFLAVSRPSTIMNRQITCQITWVVGGRVTSDE